MSESERVKRAREVLSRLESYAATRGVPLGDGPMVRLARLLIERGSR